MAPFLAAAWPCWIFFFKVCRISTLQEHQQCWQGDPWQEREEKAQRPHLTHTTMGFPAFNKPIIYVVGPEAKRKATTAFDTRTLFLIFLSPFLPHSVLAFKQHSWLTDNFFCEWTRGKLGVSIAVVAPFSGFPVKVRLLKTTAALGKTGLALSSQGSLLCITKQEGKLESLLIQFPSQFLRRRRVKPKGRPWVF